MARPEDRKQKSPAAEPASLEPVFRRRRIDWRVWIGLVLTALYLAFGIFHVMVDVGWSEFRTQSLDSQGSFLEGAFAPLAFLWLVIGYFLQYRTLQENNHNIALQYVEMRQASEYAAEQARALVASERNTRQESFVKIAELVNNQLGVTAGLLYLANQRSATVEVAPDPSSELWARVAEGDSGVFTRKLIEMCYGAAGRRRDGYRVFYGTPVRRRYTAQFLKTFEGLLAAAKESDVSGLLVDALVSGNAHGHLYRTIMEYQREGGTDRPDPVVPLKQTC
jgi:hypothetical protein